MKKTLIAVLALAAVAACNKTEVVDQPVGNAIAFDNAFVDNATKSVNDPSWSNDNMFSDFVVYGYVDGAELFPGTLVNKTITNTDLKSAWKYEGTKYWIANSIYNFNAVAPANANWTKTAASKDGVSLSFENDGTKDVLFAKPDAITAVPSQNPMVAFSFRHILSKVKFSFENAYDVATASIKVRDIKIHDAYANGNVDLNATTAWNNQTGTLVLEFGAATDNEATTDKENEVLAYGNGVTCESQKELFLIPGPCPTSKVVVDGKETDKTGYKVTFMVDLVVGETVIKSYEHTTYVALVAEPGNAYDIKATITPDTIDPENAQEPIEFTVTTVNGWTEKTYTQTL